MYDIRIRQLCCLLFRIAFFFQFTTSCARISIWSSASTSWTTPSNGTSTPTTSNAPASSYIPSTAYSPTPAGVASQSNLSSIRIL